MSRNNPSPPQPDIAAVLLAITDGLNAAGVELASGVAVITDALDADLHGDTPTHTVSDVAQRSINRFFCVDVTFSVVPSTASTQDVISSLMLRGVDGEAFAWAVIRYEAQFHQKLVWMEANRMAARMPDRTPEDLVGWGWLGLRQAMRQFDTSLGFKFSTYACHRIKGAIRDGVRDEHPVPKRLLTLQRKAAAATDELTALLGHAPSMADLAEHIEEDTQHLTEILPRLKAAASIDQLMHADTDQGAQIVDALCDDDDPADAAEVALRNEALWDALDRIDERDAEAVRFIVVDGLSVAETRRRTGVSDRELKRRVERGCVALQEALSDWAPTGL